MVKFAEPLDGIAASILGLDVGSIAFKRLRESEKDRPLTEYGTTKSLRDLLISISENTVKPILGQDYFAHRVIDRVNRSVMAGSKAHRHMVISDCGFQVEIDTLENLLPPDTRLYVIRLHRNGCSFRNDSREYIQTKEPTHTLDVMNNDDLDSLYQRLDNVLDTFDI